MKHTLIIEDKLQVLICDRKSKNYIYAYIICKKISILSFFIIKFHIITPFLFLTSIKYKGHK